MAAAGKNTAEPHSSYSNSLNDYGKGLELKSRSISWSNSESCYSLVRTRPPDHLKAIPKTCKCLSCGKKLASKLGQCRNCYMCGEVFCHLCTKYRRKSSKSGCPDDMFGTLSNVCERCSKRNIQFGVHRDLINEFKRCRKEMIAVQMAEAETTLCCSKYTPAKRKAILKAVDRLSEGFLVNSSFLSNLKAEFVVPDWQKAPHWVKPSDETNCYRCNKRFKLWDKKVNCRIGGQVFCKECGKEEIMIYIEGVSHVPKWRINGKGHVSKPARFEMYPICSGCASDLEIIIIELENLRLLHQDSRFMDDVQLVQESLSSSQRKIDEWLPNYQQKVNSLDGSNRCASDIAEDRELVKLHLDIRDILLLFKSNYYYNCLLTLRPQTAIQERLHQHIQTGAYECHKEHKRQYSCTHAQLVKHFPAQEHVLVNVQKAVSQQSMESIYIEISQLIEDISRNYARQLHIDSIVLESMMEIIQSIRVDLYPFLKGESPECHFKLVMMKREPRINVREYFDSDAERRFVVVEQCAIMIRGCYWQLQKEALDQEFQRTKKLLKETYKKLESLYAANNKCYTA